MNWEIIYHKDVDEDLKSVGPSAARRIIKTIGKKLASEPEKFGAPLSHNLRDFRKLSDPLYWGKLPLREVMPWLIANLVCFATL
jgi:hypothetical protein